MFRSKEYQSGEAHRAPKCLAPVTINDFQGGRIQMSRQIQINWKIKIIIGACGGICLTVIRLIDANFFLDYEGSTVLGGYLTALGLVILSSIFTCFVDETSHRKLFTQALLAPSLLVAMVSTGTVGHQEGYGFQEVPSEAHGTPDVRPTTSRVRSSLDGNETHTIRQALHSTNDRSELTTVLSSASMQTPTQIAFFQDQQADESLRIEPLSKRDLGSLKDGALILLGRPQPLRTFIFMVVRTTDPGRAKEIGRTLKQCLPSEMKVRLLRPDGSQEIFLAIGDFDTSQNADGIGRKAIKLLRDGCDTSAASLLRNGVIVDGRTLFN
jgi:hypothetical protein